jgi:hypothetical protein
MRALGSHERLDPKDLSADASPRSHGYAALYVAMRAGTADVIDEPSVKAALDREGTEGEGERYGLLSAIADAPPTPALSRLLDTLAGTKDDSPSWTVDLARAIASQRAGHLAPALIARLARREGREASRNALAQLGTPAFEALRRAFEDPLEPRRLRIQVPETIARFGTSQAVELLLRTIEEDRDGLVRYRAIRALGRVAAERFIRVDRKRVERLALRNMLEHFRVLGLRSPLRRARPAPTSSQARNAPEGVAGTTERILTGLLDDKIRQSLERTFRLLKVVFPREDIHSAFLAYLSTDRRDRANAAEFLDALLSGRRRGSLRELLRLAADETVSREGVELADGLLARAPSTREESLRLLVAEKDATVAALAKLHVAATEGKPMRVFIQSSGPTPVELALSEPAHG